MMSSKTDTGDSTDYAPEDEADLVAAADEGWEEFETGTPTRMTVSAVVEWSGSINKARGGQRTVRLDGLDLDGVKSALDNARHAAERASAARVATSYTAVGWQAQLNGLLGSSRGSELADRAGLNPTARTVSAWLAGDRAPSAANRAAIARAYEGLSTYRLDAVRAQAREARHAAAEMIDAAVSTRYGAQVRFFDVQSIEFED